MLLALALLWGGSFFFNGVAVRELPSLTLVWLRVLVAATSLIIPLRLLEQDLPRDGRTWMTFFGMALLNNVVPFVLIVWGQHRIASGLASILNATTPLFTVLVAHLLTSDEKLTWTKVAGLVAGFTGAAVMIGPDAMRGLGSDALAQLACLAAALSYACTGIFGRRFRRMGVPPLATACHAAGGPAVDLGNAARNTWGAVSGIGLLSTAVGYVLYFRILSTVGPINLLLVTFILPISAILLGTLVLGEVILPRHFLGMMLIGVGLMFIDGRLPRRLVMTVAVQHR